MGPDGLNTPDPFFALPFHLKYEHLLSTGLHFISYRRWPDESMKYVQAVVTHSMLSNLTATQFIFTQNSNFVSWCLC